MVLKNQSFTLSAELSVKKIKKTTNSETTRSYEWQDSNQLLLEHFGPFKTINEIYFLQEVMQLVKYTIGVKGVVEQSTRTQNFSMFHKRPFEEPKSSVTIS